jgi:hypothetical protein
VGVTGCDLLAQDCPSGQKCTVVNMNGMSTISCEPAGTIAEGMACMRSNGVDNCAAGLICTRTGSAALTCRKLCDSTTACSSGQQCGLVLRTITNVGACVPECTPFGSDCGALNCSGLVHDIGSNNFFFTCRNPGSTAAFVDCNLSNTCVADTTCDPKTMFCTPLCDNAHSCPVDPIDGGGPLSCQGVGSGLPEDPGLCQQ